MNPEFNPKRYARAGGVLYLLLIALGLVQAALIRLSWPDAAKTFANLQKSEPGRRSRFGC